MAYRTDLLASVTTLLVAVEKKRQAGLNREADAKLQTGLARVREELLEWTIAKERLEEVIKSLSPDATVAEALEQLKGTTDEEWTIAKERLGVATTFLSPTTTVSEALEHLKVTTDVVREALTGLSQ